MFRPELRGFLTVITKDFSEIGKFLRAKEKNQCGEKTEEERFKNQRKSGESCAQGRGGNEPCHSVGKLDPSREGKRQILCKQNHH